MAANNSEINNTVDKYTGLTPPQHERFMKEPAVRQALTDFRKKLDKEKQAEQGQATESPLSAFFSNLSNPFLTSHSSSSSNAAQSTPAPVSDITPIIKTLIYGANIPTKHALAERFSGEKWQRSKRLELDRKCVHVKFPDIEDNRSACRPEQWMKDAHVIFLCYNVYNRNSFDLIEKEYIKEIKREALPDVKVILVADKSTLAQEHVAEEAQKRVVTEQEGKQLAVSLKLAGHVEVSTETGEACKELLEAAARLDLKARTQLSSSSSSSASGASSSTRFGFGKS